MLLGLAVGDAVGTAVEFAAPGSFAPVTDMTGGGPFGLRPGEWTDDTAMALCLADSLIAREGWDADDCMARFVAWRDRGVNSVTGTCFDIGAATGAAIDRYRATGNPFAGSTSPGSAGHGGLMRLAPAVIAFAPDTEAAGPAAVLQSRLTHGAADCDALAGRLARLLLSGDLDAAEDAPSGDTPAGSVRGSGWVRHCWEAAVWAVRGAGSFEEAVLRAVNLGEDADTTGAVAGQIAGLIWGASGIPRRWLDRLAWADRIARTADRLHVLRLPPPGGVTP